MTLAAVGERLDAQASPAIPAKPMVRGPVDESSRVTLAGNMVRTGQDRGRVEDSFGADGLYLLLKRPPEREEALRRFLAEAQTPGSASYHQWLSPQEFGERFGPAESDVTAVSAWLESHGLRVDGVHPGRVALQFSGTAGQVGEAFHTEMHGYAREGQTFYGNSTDAQVPAAFADVIAGVSPMGSGRGRPLVRVAGKTNYNVKTHAATPAWTYPVSTASSTAAPYLFEMGPGDFAMQYGLNAVYSAGTTGAGQSIGIVSASNVDLSLVQAYRTLFGLAASVPSVVIDGDDPGQTDSATEAYLDMEEAGAVAPGASVILYTSAGTVLTDPLLTSAMRAVEDNQVSVLSVSYGVCEASLGVAGNAAWASLWQEAAAQGITVFVAAGDSGAAGCDDADAESYAESGLAVNGVGSTPYNVSVGGTDIYFSSYAAGGSALTTQVAGYWNTTSSTAPAVSLLQPIPEQAWNDSFGLNAGDAGAYSAADSSINAGGGGSSSASILSNTGGPAGYPKPAWQAGTGVTADGVRDVPDVALFAGDGENFSLYPICAMPGDCAAAGTSGTVAVTSVGGTSAATAAMAAIQALVDQATNSRQGQAATVYYALATKFTAAAVRPFSDVRTGGNQVPCFAGTLNCVLGSSGTAKGFYEESGYAAGTGYDRASGLGSVNVAALIADWGALTYRPTATTLSISQATFAHGTPASVAVTVSPRSGTGAPTGSVSLVSSSTQAYANGLGAYTLTNGAAKATVNDLPGGTYLLTADYGGDTTFAAGLSAPVLVTVTQEKDTLNTTGWVVNPLDDALYPLTAGLSFPYGAEVFFDAQPVGVNEAASALATSGPATGSVVFTDKLASGSRSATAPLNAVGLAEWAPGTGAIGTHSVTASYAGDASYAVSSTATAVNYTVFKGTTTISVHPLETSVTAGGNLTVDVEMYSDYLPLNGSLPTGMVTVTLGGKALTAAWSSSGTTGSAIEESVVTFTGVPAGILPLMASYAGDANWNGSSSVYGSVPSLGSKAAPAVTLTAATTAYTPAQTVTMTGTVTGPAAGATPTGSMLFTSQGGTASYTGALKATASNAAAYTLTLPGYALENGTNIFVATFAGDSNYSAQSSVPLAVTLNGSDFSAIVTQQELSVTYGAKGTGSVLITPINGFNSPLTVSCLAPAFITCTPAYATVTVGGGFADTITVTTAATATQGTFPVTITLTGGGHTHAVQMLVATTPPAPPPVFTPAAGTYVSAQSVTITDAAPAATIYYTTNGATPTTASAVYTGAIPVAATETIKALATAPGYLTGAAAAATYTITPPAATPVISPGTGKYTAVQMVTVSDTTALAAIYYTMDGSTPTTASTRYTGAITVGTSETLKAVAIAGSYSLSAVATATYVVTAPTATPAFSPAAGTYSTAQMVTISDATPSATIYYTTNGTTPTTASSAYMGPLSVVATETIKAVAIANGSVLSAVGSAAYTIATPAATPAISPAAGNYTQAQSVMISDATAGATIYYTTNGTTPTTASTKYAGTITISSTETVKAVAIATGYTVSAAASAAYTITTAAAAPPVTHLPPPGSPLPKR